MKKALLTIVLSMAMMAASEAQVLPLLPTNHGLTGNQPAYNSQQQQEFPTIAQGWNWWSTYIDLSNNGLGMLENMLGANALIIKSQTQFTSYDAGTWVGGLSSISNDQMYMIEMSNTPAEYVSLTSPALTINDVEITAQSGWTWIGFPSNTVISVTDALAYYDANNEDVIKSKDAFATYDNGSWIGSLTNLQPGQGYMIQNNGATQVFNYSPSARGIIENELPNTQWTAATHGFPTNMSMIATINLMGEELRSSDYEVAAFSGNVCRGTVVPQHVESIDRHIAFLSISGDNDDALQFRLLNHETGDVYIANNRYNYVTDVVEGSLGKPYVLNFNTLMGNDEFTVSHLDIFPNPATSGQMVKVSVPSNNRSLKVQVINTLGMVVKTLSMAGEEMNFAANFAPGIYTVKIVANDQQLYVEKLIVK